MSRIQRLSASVANQIAAGEVIERPASVVKELLENSLDAGANHIQVEIGSAGFSLIRISDNGAGIVADDLPLAVMAHATSKLNELSDLSRITSMGFRGEALASIASISKLSLQSKPATQLNAMMLTLDKTEWVIKPCARTQGTTVEVRDLFFNAPVRKKFLKSQAIEYQAIEQVVKRFALSEARLAVSLKHDGKLIFSLAPADTEAAKLTRIKTIFGSAFVKDAIYCDIERAGMHLTGWISGLSYQRSQQDKQWIYLNRRMVKDKLLNHAVQQAYQDFIYPGRYPGCLLYLSMPAQAVDVNVHPSKYEVRFQEPRLVHDLISSQINSELRKLNELSQTAVFGESSMQLREENPAYKLNSPLYDKKPLLANSTWITLNSQFVMVWLDTIPHMVNVQTVLIQRAKALLTQEPAPLSSRPLLVPVSYPINKTDYHQIECLKELCTQFGVDIDFISESVVVIRTIPCCLPLLDIKRFMQRLLSALPTQDSVISALSESQLIDAHQFQDEDKQIIITHLTNQATSSQNSHVMLDLNQCQRLFNE